MDEKPKLFWENVYSSERAEHETKRRGDSKERRRCSATDIRLEETFAEKGMFSSCFLFFCAPVLWEPK